MYLFDYTLPTTNADLKSVSRRIWTQIQTRNYFLNKQQVKQQVT